MASFLRFAIALLVTPLACMGRKPAPPQARTPAPPEKKPAASLRIALTHATILDVASGASQADRTIVVEGDRIVSVSPSSSKPAPDVGRTIDASGKYIIPGLWDMHVHFLAQNSGKLFVANGVTGVRVMWGNPRFAPRRDRMHFDFRDEYEARSSVGPRMIIASQILDGPKPVWPNSVALATPEEGRRAVDDAKKSGVDFIKVYSLLPRDVYYAIVDESKKQGLPFAGHVPEAVSVAEASDAGQKSIEHLTGIVVASSSREVELRKRQGEFAMKSHTPAEWSAFKRSQKAEAVASYDGARASALFTKFVANGTWQCPTLTVLHALANLDDASLASDPRLRYVPVYLKSEWNPKADFRMKDRTPEEFVEMRRDFDRSLGIVRAMNQAGVSLLAGTDEVNPYCFAGFSLHDELAWLVKAGLTPVEALRAATTAPARFLGLESKLGTVADGRLADLVVLDADPRSDIANTRKISAVVTRGALYDRAALDKMLEEAAAE
jgi:imidazolonepropionase-like amidohydrolase